MAEEKEKAKKTGPEKEEPTEGPCNGECKLGEIIGAILKNISYAQHLSNEFSKDLSTVYKLDPVLRYFPVPNAAVKEFDLGVKFGIMDAVKDPESIEYKVVVPAKAFAEGARRLAECIAQQSSQFLLPLVKKKDIKLPHDTPPETLAKNLVSPRFKEYLRMGLLTALSSNRKYLVDDQRQLNKKEAKNVIMGVLQKSVFGHRDLKSIFKPASNITKDFTKACEKDIQEQLDFIQALLKQLRLPASLDLNVITDAERLSAIPDQAVFRVDLKVELRNYKWVVAELDEGKTGAEEEEPDPFPESYLVRED